jgi:hypothetical protein
MKIITIYFMIFFVHVFVESQEEFLRTFNQDHKYDYKYDYKYNDNEKTEGTMYKLKPEYYDETNYINDYQFGLKGKLLYFELKSGYFSVSYGDTTIYFNIPKWIDD